MYLNILLRVSLKEMKRILMIEICRWLSLIDEHCSLEYTVLELCVCHRISDGTAWCICSLFPLIKIDPFLHESDNCLLGESLEGIIIYLV